MSNQTIKFLLLSRDQMILDFMKSELSRNHRHEVVVENNSKAALLRMQQGDIDCIIFNLDQFIFSQVKLLEQIKSLKQKFKIFVFATEVNPLAAHLASPLRGITVFGKTFINMEKDFLGLILRFMKVDGIPQRSSKRHSTFQRGLVVNLRAGKKFDGLVSNLSRQGAHLEYSPEKGNLVVGDKVVLTVELHKLSRVHNVVGLVVWARTSLGGKSSAGLKFT